MSHINQYEHLFSLRSHSEFLLVNQSLHLVFVCLPVLWALGILPPLDALWLWLGEQALVFLFGGSPMASDARFVSHTINLLFNLS